MGIGWNMRNGLLLVAEQDVSGRVVAVWKRAESDRVARLMRRNDLNARELDHADFHGASSHDIADFIQNLPLP